ncbi:hypothetical protein F2Q70_00013603 [Brassica cretica]|uniref:Uncharacterized protein n=1 Tax=Brassica cretica TaxID=69181 RepID=A0A8S9ME57_BRACR|nr:hypothetical protein F2Q70_00013603 [Brassica cretica]
MDFPMIQSSEVPTKCSSEFSSGISEERSPRKIPRNEFLELHRYIRSLPMDGDILTVRFSLYFDTRYSFEFDFQCHPFEVNPTVRSKVMPVLLKSGMSASREEAVEETKECRSTTQETKECRSTTQP